MKSVLNYITENQMINHIENIIEVLECSINKFMSIPTDGEYIINEINYQWGCYTYNKVTLIVIVSNENEMFRIKFDGNDIVSYFYQLNIINKDSNIYENIFNLNNITDIQTYDQYFQQSTIQDLSWITLEQLRKLNSVVNSIINKVINKNN